MKPLGSSEELSYFQSIIIIKTSRKLLGEHLPNLTYINLQVF